MTATLKRGVGGHRGEGRVEKPVVAANCRPPAPGRGESPPARTGARVACVPSRWQRAAYSSMARRSKHTVEEAGFDISGSENLSNPVFQVAKSSERTVARRRRRVTARIRFARRGTKVGIHREWKNAGPRWDFREGFTTRHKWRPVPKFFGGVREALCRRVDTFFPHTLRRPWTTHSTRGLCRNSPEILQLRVPSGEASFAALVGLFSLGGECFFFFFFF